MKDCDDRAKEVNCGAGFDRCVKMSLDFDVGHIETKSYATSCFTKSSCESGNDIFKQCKNIDGAECDLNCCDEDLCNGGTVATVSFILMVACALLALFR